MEFSESVHDLCFFVKKNKLDCFNRRANKE